MAMGDNKLAYQILLIGDDFRLRLVGKAFVGGVDRRH
jgi:hypothetical protein